MQDLVDQAKQGDLQAYGSLVEQYERTVLATAMAIIRDRHTAEDVTQDVFIQAYQKINSLRDASRFPYWLLKIARREAVRTAQQRSRRQALPIENEDVSTENSFVDEEKEHLLQQVEKLPPHEQLMISLRYFDGHSIREIAEMTGRPVGTVTKQMSRAIARLKHSFKAEETR